MNLLNQYKNLRNEVIQLVTKVKESKRTESGKDIYEWSVGDRTEQFEWNKGAKMTDELLMNIIGQSIRMQADKDEPDKKKYLL